MVVVFEALFVVAKYYPVRLGCGFTLRPTESADSTYKPERCGVVTYFEHKSWSEQDEAIGLKSDTQ